MATAPVTSVGAVCQQVHNSGRILIKMIKTKIFKILFAALLPWVISRLSQRTTDITRSTQLIVHKKILRRDQAPIDIAPSWLQWFWCARVGAAKLQSQRSQPESVTTGRRLVENHQPSFDILLL